MAIYQPTNITPDLRGPLGNGVVPYTPSTQYVEISWQINGNSPMSAFKIDVLNTSGTVLYSTGQLTTHCPFYGTDATGVVTRFSYQIARSDLWTAGVQYGEYRLLITQYWGTATQPAGTDYSLAQESASAFRTLSSVPSVSISNAAATVPSSSYTFQGAYSGDWQMYTWARWQLYRDTDNDGTYSTLIDDTGPLYGVTELAYTYDGFLPHNGSPETGGYCVKLTVQSASGMTAQTSSYFIVYYSTQDGTGSATAVCNRSVGAVQVSWTPVYVFNAQTTGAIVYDGRAVISAAGSAVWSGLSLASPWGLIWHGQLSNADATLLTIDTVETGESVQTATITASYNKTSKTITVGNLNFPGAEPNTEVWLLITYNESTQKYDVYCCYAGGLAPSETLTPNETLTPSDAWNQFYGTLTGNVYDVVQVTLGGAQFCYFLQLLSGPVPATTIFAVYDTQSYVPGFTGKNYMLTQFPDSGFVAGSMDFGGKIPTAILVYRYDGTNLVSVGKYDISVSSILDYSAVNDVPAQYWILLESTQNGIITGAIKTAFVTPCFWVWEILECQQATQWRTKQFSVLRSYIFKYNVESGAVSNNNAPGIYKNFTRYPTVQIAPHNYQSGTLTGLIGTVSNGVYDDTVAQKNALFALSTSTNPLFLRNRKGELLRIQLAGEISASTADTSIKQQQTATVPWVETGSADGVGLSAAV